ncbi:MAG TPA: hypothetical protein VFD92_09410 [Candidatus Binatia bacterium]|nr:hypothetical protein [Candidatus Binatia bacterium]
MIGRFNAILVPRAGPRNRPPSVPELSRRPRSTRTAYRRPGVRCALSANGRYVLFGSHASDLVANDANDAFVRDLRTGTTTLVSVNRTGRTTPHIYGLAAGMSDDGRVVAFKSNAADLVPNDTNGRPDAFVRELR